MEVSNIARWDGDSWAPLAGPIGNGIDGEGSPVVYSLIEWNRGKGGDLVAAGSFDLAGGLASANISRWTCGVGIFADGFESGDTSAWAVSVP